MSANTPISEALNTTPSEEPRVIRQYLAHLLTRKREAAVTGLTKRVVVWLTALTGSIDATVRGLQPALNWVDVLDEAAIRHALLAGQPDPVDPLAFYQRAATVMRKAICRRLKQVIDDAPDRASPLVKRLMWWIEFHRVAGKLPRNLRATLDVREYCRQPAQQVVGLLGVPPEAVERDTREAVNRLRPLFDRARGKA